MPERNYQFAKVETFAHRFLVGTGKFGSRHSAALFHTAALKRLPSPIRFRPSPPRAFYMDPGGLPVGLGSRKPTAASSPGSFVFA